LLDPPPDPEPPELVELAEASTAGPVCTVPVDPLLPFPPPSWSVPVEPPAALPPLPPIAIGVEAVVLPEVRLGLLLGPLDWTVAAEPEASLPPPTCAVPVELLAELPDPAMPAEAPTVASRPAGVTFADGAVSIPLACAVPVELEASLPPPTWATPVELEAVLSPRPMLSGTAALSLFVPFEVLAPLFAEVGEDCTVPVEPDALLLPPPPSAVEPDGAATLPPPAAVPTVAVGSAVTEPICTAPVEPVVVFSASAGAAVASTAVRPAARPKVMLFMVPPLVGVEVRRAGAVAYKSERR
jgi:hypothetical protein